MLKPSLNHVSAIQCRYVRNAVETPAIKFWFSDASPFLIKQILDGTEDFLATVLSKLCPQMELKVYLLFRPFGLGMCRNVDMSKRSQ